MKRKSLFIFLGIVALITGACSTGNISPNSDTSDVEPSTVSGVDNSDRNEVNLEVSDVRTVASAIYETLYTGEDVTPILYHVFDALGVPVLDADSDLIEIENLIQTGLPFLLEFEIPILADAYARGMMVDLESVIEDMTEKGFRAAESLDPVSVSYLSDGLRYLTTQENFTDVEVPMALMLALGNERAQRSERGVLDPTFGDDRLDPLQLALLFIELYTVSEESEASTGAAPVMASSLWILTYPKPSFQPPIPPPLAGLLAPLAPIVVARDLVCTSVWLYSHKATMELDHHELYRRAPGSDRPDISKAKFTLKFSFVPHSQNHLRVLEILQCGDFPKNEPRGDVRVEWYLQPSYYPTHAQLEDQGALSEWYTFTEDDGVATTTFQTFDEALPQEFWMAEKMAFGHIEARAKGLVPWSVIRLVLENGPRTRYGFWAQREPLKVFFHPAPLIELKVETGGASLIGSAHTCDGQKWLGNVTATQNQFGVSFEESGIFEFTMTASDGGFTSGEVEFDAKGFYSVPDQGDINIVERLVIRLDVDSEGKVTWTMKSLGAQFYLPNGQVVPFPMAMPGGGVDDTSETTRIQTNEACGGS